MVVFDKTAFVYCDTSNNFKQNVDGARSNQPKIYRKIPASGFKKAQEKNPRTKSLETLTKCL